MDEISSLISTTYAPFTDIIPSNYSSTTEALHNVSKCDLPVKATLEVILYCTFMVFILFTSVVGNGVVIISVLLSKKLKGRSTFYFVGSLAVSNAIMALFQIPFRISLRMNQYSFCFATSVCFLRMIMDAIGNIASILNLLFISLDRFIAIQIPYRYLEYLSKKRCKQIISSIWIFSIIWSISQIFHWGNKPRGHGIISIMISPGGWCMNTNITFFHVSFCGIFVPVLILISFTYMKILQIALHQIRKSERRITILSVNNASPNLPADHMTSPNIHDQEKARNRRVSKLPCVIKELKTTKSIATVYVAFSICWLPSCIFHIILIVNPDFYFQTFVWLVFVDIFPMISTAINPFIYAFMNKEFRDAVHYIWRKLLVKLKLRDSYLSRKDTARVTYVRSNPNITGLDPYGKLSPLTSNNNSPICVNKYAG